MKKTRKKLNNRGFTLLEVLVAIVIIGIIGTGVLSICVSSVKTSLKTSRTENAAAYAGNINEIWLWHKRYNPQKLFSDEKAFQTFHYSLARFIFTNEYNPNDENSDPEIYTCLRTERNDGSDIKEKTCFVVYFDSSWKQLKVPIVGETRTNNDDVLESDVSYSIVITSGSVSQEGGSVPSANSPESIRIEIYTGFVDPSQEEYASIKADGERLIGTY